MLAQMFNNQFILITPYLLQIEDADITLKTATTEAENIQDSLKKVKVSANT